MIDLHCHLLPGIDDGPNTKEEALELARIACLNGIKKAVVTPHIIPGRYDNTLESITTVFTHFREALKKEHIPLQLGMAAEVRLDTNIMQMVETDSLPILGQYDGFDIFLLEFPHEHIPPGGEEIVEWLLKRNIKPMIAHPERNRSVMNNIERIAPFVKAGCLLQITSGSLTGTFGHGPADIGKELLKRDWVSIIASDAHNKQKRPPEIEPGRAIAEEISGKEKAWEMVNNLPLKIAQQHFSATA